MGYKLLGMAVWKGGQWYVRRRYGSGGIPKPVIAGGAVAVVAGVVLLARRNSSQQQG
jgi:hypothetical protein